MNCEFLNYKSHFLLFCHQKEEECNQTKTLTPTLTQYFNLSILNFLILGIMGEYEGVPRSNISKTNPYAKKMGIPKTNT
jgi:hypothetical protein